MADDVHGVMGFMLYVFMGNVADDDNDDDDDLGCEGRFHYQVREAQRALILYLYRPALLNHKP